MSQESDEEWLAPETAAVSALQHPALGVAPVPLDAAYAPAPARAGWLRPASRACKCLAPPPSPALSAPPPVPGAPGPVLAAADRGAVPAPIVVSGGKGVGAAAAVPLDCGGGEEDASPAFPGNVGGTPSSSASCLRWMAAAASTWPWSLPVEAAVTAKDVP